MSNTNDETIHQRKAARLEEQMLTFFFDNMRALLEDTHVKFLVLKLLVEVADKVGTVCADARDKFAKDIEEAVREDARHAKGCPRADSVEKQSPHLGREPRWEAQSYAHSKGTCK